jgi:hypothetical protein
MAVPVKQPIEINFQKGLNLKTDPYQVPVGSFLRLINSVFDKVGRLTKRNGFPYLTPIPNTTTSYLTTFNGDLQAIGPELLALSTGENKWIDKGSTYPIQLSTMALVRNSVNQSYADCAIAPNGLICTAYTEQDLSGAVHKYVVADSVTGQNIVAPTLLPSADATYGTPRVYVVGNYFVILYTQHSGNYSINYLAIPYLNTSTPTSMGFITGYYTPATTVAFDAVLMAGTLFIAYNGNGTGIQMLSMDPTLTLTTSFQVDPTHQGTIFSMAADEDNGTVWVTYFSGSTGYSLAVDNLFVLQMSPTLTVPSGTILNIASTAQNDTLSFWYEVDNNYSYDASIPSHFIKGNTCTISGTVGTAFFSVRSVGLASKAFLVDGVSYFLSAYQSQYQPTYFLINGTVSTSASPVVVAKLAYSNGGGYLTTGLPNVTQDGVVARVPYLRKDLIQAVNKNTNVPSGSQVDGIYSQTGVNSATLTFSTDGIATTEIGQDLHLTGGFLWMYDGYLPVEHNFFLWPDNIKAVADPASGSMSHQEYFYQVVYEWADNQGNIFRSAPSIPVSVTLTSDSSVALSIPTLRLTYKVLNPVKITIYRWSTAQQSYYQVTNLTFTTNNPLTLNSTTVDSVTFIDKASDADILGNNLLYTTGGVVEDVNAPPSNIMALFDDRLWLVDAEDQNLLWFSKQVIEATPVEMSDLFTFYVAPSTGAQGSTGVIKALFPLDDKLIIFKSNALYYINGTGPDNTGAQNNYSQPIFIPGTVGCSNPRSIVLTPSGLMFQSNKGIWLLGRDMSTSYIGAAVEDFNDQTVISALSIPATNQVRFGLDGGSVLLYDYFIGQWGEFQGIPSVAACLYNDKHTIVNQYGLVSQELPGTYLDGTRPVLMSFTTSWLRLEGIRGYMRAFWFYLLGTYLSPHKLNLSIAYDYNESAVQSDLIAPINYAGPYGDDPYYGGDGHTTYGGPTNIEQWRIFLERQRCKSFQITMQEVFDPTFGTVAGPGLTLSGVSCIVGLKNSFAPIPQNQQVG